LVVLPAGVRLWTYVAATSAMALLAHFPAGKSGQDRRARQLGEFAPGDTAAQQNMGKNHACIVATAAGITRFIVVFSVYDTFGPICSIHCAVIRAGSGAGPIDATGW
jgi:hypothetical protein